MKKGIDNKIYKDKVDNRYCIKIRSGDNTIFVSLDSSGNRQTFSMAEHEKFVKEIKNPSTKEKSILKKISKGNNNDRY